MNYYELLEVSRNASHETILAAYKAMCKKYHPDNYHDNGERMKEINEAFSVLGNEEKRRAYDEYLDSPPPEGDTGTERQTENTENPKDSETPEKMNVFTFIGGCIVLLFQGIFTVLEYAWGLLVILVIIGFFTGHSQRLFGTIFDWILGFFGA